MAYTVTCQSWESHKKIKVAQGSRDQEGITGLRGDLVGPWGFGESAGRVGGSTGGGGGLSI